MTGGELSIPQIVSQLQRLVPTKKFRWDVRQVGHNVFKVQFPTQIELERLKIFGTCRVPNNTCELTFETWSAKAEPLLLLPEVWVLISGIPSHRIGDFFVNVGTGTANWQDFEGGYEIFKEDRGATDSSWMFGLH